MKKRSEGYFGLHFDFHAGADCTQVGKTVTEEMVREIIEIMRPDFIQCDCKGHAGYSSYPTKVGNPAPGFVKDQLEIWRKTTKQYGIPLAMHYSGVWDTKAMEAHPEWAATNEDGSQNKNMASTFKGYADGLLIPQLCELANGYGVDAAWIDGECWATVPDFDEERLAAFEKESGLKLVKDGEGKYDRRSKEYRGFLDFCRKRFFEYLAHYVDEVHNRANNFEIASNWAFSSHIPAPVCADVDYLSGDFTPIDSYNGARFEGRALCGQGKPWDLMAWGFFHDFSGGGRAVKSAVSLCREAAGVLPLGGGFQMYNTQNRDGSVRLWEIRELAEVSKFVREREPFLKGSKPLSDIGILYSYYDMANKSDSLFFAGGNEETKGAVKLVLDSANPCGIVMDHMLTPEFLEGKTTMILPEIKYMSGEIKDKLLKFVDSGGNIIISGYECCKLFEQVLDGVKIDGRKDQTMNIYDNMRYICQKANLAEATVSESETTKILRKCSSGAYGIGESTELNASVIPIATQTKYGKGNIVAIYYNIFELYSQAPDFYIRNMVAGFIDELGPEKLVGYEGQKFVDIVPSEKDGSLLINLTNTSGIYAENRLRAYDEITPLCDMRVTARIKKEPKSVTLQPEGKILDYKYDPASGKLTVEIGRLDIHAIIMIDY
ncbi:MAG: alpha-L-fucosidase [Oscillospiraceae bacterium]|nr:alpha-L-fucosidase [Oscillospiraceae bacterium]